LDTGLYERVEIVRGATGLSTGAGSPSAAVNLVRKHADAGTFEMESQLSAASWNDRRALADLSTPLSSDGTVRGRVVGVYQQRESYQDLYETEKKVLYAIVDADLAPATRLSLGYDFQDYQPQANTWGSFPLFLSDGSPTDWDRSVTTATDWSFWNKRTQTGFLELRTALPGRWTLRGSLTHRVRRDDLALFYVYGFPDPDDGTGLVPYAYREKVETRQDALDLLASGPFSLLGREHELVAGYNGSRLDVHSDEFAHGSLPDTGNFFEWDGSYPMPVFGDGTPITDVDARQHGAYLAARLSLADPLELIAGARFNRWNTDYYYVYTGPRPFVHEHEQTTPYAGLIWDVSRSWSLFTSYTEIFKPQNAREQGGRYLDPVEGSSVELGVKGEHFDGRFNTSLTVFDTRQDNVATPAFNADGSEAYVTGTEPQDPDEQDRRVRAAVAIDGTRSRGFELDASGSPLAGWNASLGWSHYRLEDGDGEDVKPWIPRTLVRAFTTYNPQGVLRKLTVGGGVNWQSASEADVSGPLGGARIEQDRVTLLGLMARWNFTPGLSLQINGDNLLDEKYYVLDEYGNLYFGTPAKASASLSWRF
jgi:outer membrane receptor for ferric coprogen and ferric-rhodotorulic acid